MIQFIHTLRVPEGMNTGHKFILRCWQQDIIREVYNPIDDSGTRIVRKAIFSEAKKNGKTPIIAAIGLGHIIGPEAKFNEQIYSAAFDRDQASITFRYMSQMIYMDEELADNLVVRDTKKEIYCPKLGNIYKALSSEVKGKHGLGPAVLIMDELAQFGSDRTFYDTLQQGRGAHREPILWIISTQAADDKAVLSQEIDTALRVQDPAAKDYDPTVRCFLFTTPPELDPFDRENWKLSNPALGDFLNMADMEEASRTARNMPSAEANFRNLRLNQRIDASEHFLSPTVWKACGAEPYFENFEEFPCIGGLDLSGKNDLTSLVLVAECESGIFDVKPFFWTPADGLREKEKRDRAPYCTWRDQGFLEAVPGRVIDYRYVSRKIGELQSEGYRIQSLKFDRWRINDFRRAMSEEGIECYVYGSGLGCDWSEDSKNPEPDGIRLVPHGQGYRDMNPAVETVEDLVTQEKIRHGMHPVLTWCASNTRIQKDPAGNRKFDKLKSTGRIDGMTALAMALNGAMASPKTSEERSFWETMDPDAA